MSLEIEHKYLVTDDSYKKLAAKKVHIMQGYISREKERTVRIRVKDSKAYITIKTKNIGDTRNEFEYEIPKSDALKLLKICNPPVIEKYRYIVEFKGFTWEVDEFQGELCGIVIAEIELPTSDTVYETPPFIGKNVTGMPEYYNSNIHLLAKK